jgi:hypothetical protein
MDLYSEFLSIVESLTEAGVDYAVCGGVAVALHGCPRFTRGIDILIPPDQLEQAEKTVRRHGYVLTSGRLPFDAGTPQERTIYRISKAEGEDLITLDLVLVAPVFQGAWEGREVFEVQGRELTIVSLEGLLEMKRIAGRPQDLLDIHKLTQQDSEHDDGTR